MSLLSKSEIQFLRGQKQASKSYEYKLKSVIKKKIANLMRNELPLISNSILSIDLTEISKKLEKDSNIKLTDFSKTKLKLHNQRMSSPNKVNIQRSRSSNTKTGLKDIEIKSRHKNTEKKGAGRGI